MQVSVYWILTIGLLTVLAVNAAEPDSLEGYAKGSALCLSCHNFGATSPAQIMLDSKHGNQSNQDTPMAQLGCQSCHGPTLAHTQAPTKVSPGVSFGPRWTTEIEQQNTQCLNCHEKNEAQHWSGNTHDKQQLTCVTCHDLHSREDKVLVNAQLQAQVCTTCHKTQKEGIHALSHQLENNPPCRQCHNPHANAKPLSQLVENRSQGCRQCHDLVAMASNSPSTSINTKAISYHKTMVQLDHSCIDCHKNIAHVAAANIEPVIPQAVSKGNITLFYPAQSDLDWLLSEHPGSQAFRQGRNCQQCHRGEEPAMGKTLAGELQQATLTIDVQFQRQQNDLLLSLSWEGKRSDQDVAVMWGASGYDAFSRTGCWAACHSDMTGMSRDRGQQTGKYLALSRAQIQRIGQPAQIKTAAELDALMSENKFVNLWRVTLNQGDSPTLETGKILAELVWTQETANGVTANYQNGRWQVRIRRPINELFAAENTFGIAVHGVDRSGVAHWVSLPFSFGLNSTETDFTAE